MSQKTGRNGNPWLKAELPPEIYTDPARTPEQRMLMAMVVQAIIDCSYTPKYQDTRCSAVNIRREARRFVTYDGDEPYTFRWSAEHLFEDSEAFIAAARRFIMRPLPRDKRMMLGKHYSAA